MKLSASTYTFEIYSIAEIPTSSSFVSLSKLVILNSLPALLV